MTTPDPLPITMMSGYPVYMTATVKRAVHRLRWDADPDLSSTPEFGSVRVPALLVLRIGWEVRVGDGGISTKVGEIDPAWWEDLSAAFTTRPGSSAPRLSKEGYATWADLHWDWPFREPHSRKTWGFLPEFDLSPRRSTVRGAKYIRFLPLTAQVPSWDDWVGSLH